MRRCPSTIRCSAPSCRRPSVRRANRCRRVLRQKHRRCPVTKARTVGPEDRWRASPPPRGSTAVSPRGSRAEFTAVGPRDSRAEVRRRTSHKHLDRMHECRSAGRQLDLRRQSDSRRRLRDHPRRSLRPGDVQPRLRSRRRHVPNSRGALAERHGPGQERCLCDGLSEPRTRRLATRSRRRAWPPGEVPPRFEVDDDGIIVRITNLAPTGRDNISVARVRADPGAPGGWRGCALLATPAGVSTIINGWRREGPRCSGPIRVAPKNSPARRSNIASVTTRAIKAGGPTLRSRPPKAGARRRALRHAAPLERPHRDAGIAAPSGVDAAVRANDVSVTPQGCATAGFTQNRGPLPSRQRWTVCPASIFSDAYLVAA